MMPAPELEAEASQPTMIMNESEHYFPERVIEAEERGTLWECPCGAEFPPSEATDHYATCLDLRREVDRRRPVWLQRPGWMRDAACRGATTDQWYSEETSEARAAQATGGEGLTGEVLAAKAVCYGCPVRAECLEYALISERRARYWRGAEEWEEGIQRDGVWGGLSPAERHRVADLDPALRQEATGLLLEAQAHRHAFGLASPERRLPRLKEG